MFLPSSDFSKEPECVANCVAMLRPLLGRKRFSALILLDIFGLLGSENGGDEGIRTLETLSGLLP